MEQGNVEWDGGRKRRMGWEQTEVEYAKHDTYLVTNDDFSQQRGLLGNHS